MITTTSEVYRLIARVGWVLENYDTVEVLYEKGEKAKSSEFRDEKNNPAPQIRYIKKIDGTYYVVEAVADNSYKKLWVQSVYLRKNKEDVTQAPDADNVAPETTAETAPPSPSSSPIISGEDEKVNSKKVNREKKITPKEEEIVRKVGKALGLEVEFKDLGWADGKITGNKVTINIYATNPVRAVIKHEFTHSFESSKHYSKFQQYVTRNSKAFKQWLKENGFETTAQAIKETQERYAAQNEELTYPEAKAEVIADFVGDMLFNKGANITDSITEDFLSELARADRNLFERFAEWIESLVKRLKGTAVEKDIVKLEQMVKRLKETTDTDQAQKGGKTKYLYVGEKAKTADKLQLETAKQMLKDGADSELIRRETGWFKGMDGKWRFEINDKDIDVKRVFFTKAQIAGEYYYMLTKRQQGKSTKEETEIFLQKMQKFVDSGISEGTLEKYITHKELFKAYPQLKKVGVSFDIPTENWSGKYDPLDNKIVINCRIAFEEDWLKKVFVHEIQHAIQYIEGFAKGSSNVYWDYKKSNGETFIDENGKELSSYELYERTAGEIEARDSMNRIDFSDENRKEIRPDIDRENVVFAEYEDTTATGGTQYSIPSDHTFVYNQGKASFTEQRLTALLDDHSLGDGRRTEHTNAYVGYISPEDFLKLTANDKIRSQVEEDAYVLNEEELKGESETPFLEYDPSTGEVVNHEGRHRMVALKADGISSVAIVLKPSNDSFERREPQNISLTGQSFKDGRAAGKVTVSNAIPLSEKYRSEAVAQFAKNPDADIRYSIPRQHNYSRDEINDNINKVAKMKTVYTVSEEKLKRTGKKPSDIFTEFFSSLGNNIYTEEFGDISLGKSSVRSEIRHGVTSEKIASIEAIPSVLKQGKVIFSGFKTNSDVERIVVCAPINIGIKPYYMGVMLQRDSQNQRLYLHNVILKEEATDSSQADLLTTGADDENDHLFITSILQKVLTVKKKTQYSIPTNAIGKSREELKAMVESGEITLDEAFESLTDQYGTMPPGENPKVDVTFPKKISKNQNVMRYARNAAESGHLDEGMSETQKMDILKGGQTYQAISDKSATNKADEAVRTDFAGAVRKWDDVINSGKLMNKYDIALGERLLQQAAENGHVSDTMKYIAELAEVGTRMGQNIQALSLLKKMTGIGKLYYIQRSVDSLNRDIEQKYGGKKEPVKINTDLAEMLAKSKSQKDAEAIADDMLKDIADQVPSTFIDKWNAWRYLSMLGNPRTHIRNVAGNAVFVPAIRIKDGMAYVGERFISKDKRTKVLGTLKAEYKDFARNDFKEMQDILTGGGKMNPSDQIRDKQSVFKNKLLEAFRVKNFDAMEAEDMLFLKMHYVRALGSIMQARGLDVNNISAEQLNEARIYAVKEAQKATYRDSSAVAEALNRFQYSKSKSVRSFGLLVEGVLPFKKTPINILKRGIEYSPIGLTKSLTKGVVDLKKGKITASEFIDGISAGLTGTGIMILGAFLQSLGIVVGGLGYDDEDALERMAGAQEYALQIGDVSYTIDWMAPAVLPFLVGAEVQKFLSADEERSTMSFFVDAVTAIGEPMTELSMLSGLNDAIEAVAYSDNKLTDMVLSSGMSYLSQALPTVGGQIARTADDTRRANYIDKNSDVPTSVQSFYQKAIGKVPGLENTKTPYIDAWGRTESTGNIAGRALQNFVSPGYVSKVEDDTINKEIARLYVETGEGGVIPQRAKNSFEVNGSTKYLTSEEYVKYATEKGQTARKYAEELFGHPMYLRLDNAGKADVLKNLYSYANAKAKSLVSDYDLESVSTYKTAAKLEKAGVDPVDYYIAKTVTSVENADKDGSGTVTKNEYTSALKKSGLSSSVQKKILSEKYSSKK